MKSEDISDSLNYLDDDIIAETAKVRERITNKEESHKDDMTQEANLGPQMQKIRSVWFKWGAIAACLCVLIIAGVIAFHAFGTSEDPVVDKNIAENQNMQNQEDSDLENQQPDSTASELAYASDELQIIELDMVYEGAGFEGLMYYTIKELYEMNLANHPLDSTMEFDTLPIYKDEAHSDTGIGIALSETQLNEIAQEIAGVLDAEILEITPEKIKIDGRWMVYTVFAKTEQAKITVYGDGKIRIDFSWYDIDTGEHNTTMLLPDSINNDDTEAVVNYWIKQLPEILNGQTYQTTLMSEYTFDGTLLSTYGYYEYSDDPVENLLNYTIRQGNVGLDEKGNLTYIIIVNDLTYAEKIGDYPVISVEDAKNLLLDGYYLTSVPYDITDKHTIAGVELIYKNPLYGEYIVPYYRYYVELPEETHNSLKCYGAYYVPAIEQDYISDMQIYDGQHN